MKLLRKVVSDVLSLFYPSICLGCGSSLVENENTICFACWGSFPKTNFHRVPDNIVAQRLFGRVPVQHACSFYYFQKESKLQHILHALKYKGNQDIGFALGKQMGLDVMHATWIKEIEAIIPVPLSKEKFKHRGYNQSELLAIGLAEILQKPVLTDVLLRTKNTKTQTAMHIRERQANVRNAFKVQNENKIANKHILMVDDVFTTGATIEACILAMREIESLQFSILTLAYAIE